MYFGPWIYVESLDSTKAAVHTSNCSSVNKNQNKRRKKTEKIPCQTSFQAVYFFSFPLIHTPYENSKCLFGLVLSWQAAVVCVSACSEHLLPPVSKHACRPSSTREITPIYHLMSWYILCTRRRSTVAIFNGVCGLRLDSYVFSVFYCSRGAL